MACERLLGRLGARITGKYKHVQDIGLAIDPLCIMDGEGARRFFEQDCFPR
jgi:hypothetical protein